MSKLKLYEFSPSASMRVFGQDIGHLHLEKDPFNISPIIVNVKETIVCLFETVHMEILRIDMDQNPPVQRVDELRSFSILYEFESWTEDHGVLIFHRCVDEETIAKVGRTKSRLRKFYRKAKEGIVSKNNTKLIYEGNRNEG